MTDTRDQPVRLTGPRVELICPGCRRVHEHPADDRGRSTTCPECEREFQAAENVPIIYVPWEDRQDLGWFRALGETVWTSLVAPKTFFRRMPISGGWLAPLSYLAIVGGVALLGAGIWVFLVLVPTYFPEGELSLGACVTSTALAGLEGVTLLSFYAALVHLAVLLFGGTVPGMQTTVRVVAYSCSALLLAVLPYIGVPLALLWTLVLCVIGLRETQELSTIKAIFAALSPLLFFYVMRSFLTALAQGAQPTQPQ